MPNLYYPGDGYRYDLDNGTKVNIADEQAQLAKKKTNVAKELPKKKTPSLTEKQEKLFNEFTYLKQKSRLSAEKELIQKYGYGKKLK